MLNPPGMTSVSETHGSKPDESLVSPKQIGDLNSDCLADGFREERFRIDRKKLEIMLQVQPGGSSSESAEAFFQRVMLETSTQISWPSKLKIGAKSKKDPHVKILGIPEFVQMAKQRILEVLDTKKDRVTLKMDVSHSDHSYIIGKGGFKIQQVMEETGCHIHFPDSNRSSATEKSNQVSIAGQANSVEEARSKIRGLLPFEYIFELPNGDSVTPGKETSPDIQHIQQTYSFNVAFRPIGLGRTLLVVRSCHRLLTRLRQGLALLIEYLTGSKMVPLVGFMKTEVAVQHHPFVMGPSNANLQMITNKTGASVLFPETLPFEQSAQGFIFGQNILKGKSTVIIQGSFDSVCLAWQELLKCLPLVLMFDLKEGQELDPVIVNKCMETFDLNIMIRPKTKENIKSVIIRGSEKDSKILFQVRQQILGHELNSTSKQPSRTPEYPESDPPFHRKVPILQLTRPPIEVPQSTENMSTVESLNLLSNIIQRNPEIIGLLSSLTLPTSAGTNIPVLQSIPSTNSFRNPGSCVNQQLPLSSFNDKGEVETWVNKSERVYAMSMKTRHYQRDLQNDIDSDIFQPASGKPEKGGHPESSASSTCSRNSFFGKIPQSSEEQVHRLRAEYDNKRLSATKAMQQPVGSGARTPTKLWSGYGFSKSMPDFALRAKLLSSNCASPSANREGETASDCDLIGATASVWNEHAPEKNDGPLEPSVAVPFSCSNFWENVPQPAANYGSVNDLVQLLAILDLEKYNEHFAQHEIDFATFMSLNDMDLQHLNVGYSARCKMLSAIDAIRGQCSGDWPVQHFSSVAPGAERSCF